METAPVRISTKLLAAVKVMAGENKRTMAAQVAMGVEEMVEKWKIENGIADVSHSGRIRRRLEIQ